MTTLGTIDVTFNTADAQELLKVFANVMPDAAAHALKVVAEELLRDSKLYVPVLTGALKDSGRVEELPTIDDALRVVRVIYGSADVLYARIQHEKPFNHPSLGFFGPAKFLQEPLTRNAQFYGLLLVAEYELYLTQNLPS